MLPDRFDGLVIGCMMNRMMTEDPMVVETVVEQAVGRVTVLPKEAQWFAIKAPILMRIMSSTEELGFWVAEQ